MSYSQTVVKQLNTEFLTPEEVLNDEVRICLLVVRTFALILVVMALTVHIRSIKVFRWELAVSAGILVTYTIVNAGLTVSAGLTKDKKSGKHKGMTSQVFLTGVGALVFAVNAATVYRRWKHSHQVANLQFHPFLKLAHALSAPEQVTQVVAEMLNAIGLPIKRQIKTKVFLSAGVSLCLLLDLLISPFLYRRVVQV